MKIVPTVKEITSAKSWQANLPWIIVGAGVAIVATWFFSNYVAPRIIPAQAIEMRSPTRIVPEPAYAVYHPSYNITHAPTPTYSIGVSSPTQGVHRFRVY